MAVNLKAELEASKSLVELLELADRTRQLYQSARLPLPDALRRLLGSNGNLDEGIIAGALQKIVPPIPPEAEADWSWVPQNEGAPMTLIKAILRANPTPLRSTELHERIVQLGIDASLGTVSNAAVRLEGNGIIKREDGCWSLINVKEAGVIFGGHIWGPRETFTAQELAAHRRLAILQILAAKTGGLQLVQITEELRRTEWVHAPINKDLVKADMDGLLGKRKVRRIGNSRKWGLALEGGS
jgi:hypothetical protein